MSDVGNAPQGPPDPARVPVLSVDDHLPAVHGDGLLPRALRARFLCPPVWTPEILAERRFTDRPMRQAAVLVGLVMRTQPTVLLTQRTAHLSSHPGQIAFPGGQIDPTDAGPVAAALREAQEEVGLDPERAEVLGQLPVYTTGSAYQVTPVVALVDPRASYSANAHEVDSVFEVPLNHVMNPANHRHHELDWEGQRRRWLSMPYRDADGRTRFIWGATAAMIRNLYRFLIA